MRRWADIATVVLLGLGAVAYIGAKVHFFSRYGVPGYLSEHWPFWAGMGCIAVLAWLLERLGHRHNG